MPRYSWGYLREALVDVLVAGAGTAGAASALGRPVLMEGTACTALRRAASDMAARTFKPARNSSLFFTGWARAAERCFRVSMTAYSSLGIVKLSRTSLGFLALVSRAAAGAAGALANFGVTCVAVDAFFLEAEAGFVAAFWGCLATAAVLAGALVAAAAGLTDFAAVVGAGLGEGAAGRTGLEVVMANKRFQ